MSKAMRQMLEQSGRAGVAHGEAACDLVSDEACGPPLEHQGTGSAKPMAGTGGLLEAALTRENLDCPDSPDLKLSNRPVRIRMPGGVAGVFPMMEAPYADCLGLCRLGCCWSGRSRPAAFGQEQSPDAWARADGPGWLLPPEVQG